MIKFLISRPVAVCMAFTAFFILGIVTYLNIPVSLLPDIAIPEVTVQVSSAGTSARELENTVVSPVRQQLLQIAGLRDIRTETRDGAAIVRLVFEYGANTDLAFIEVNEKIDAAMNYLPRETERPRVIKASATDIPVLDLNLTLNTTSGSGEDEQVRFLALSEFAESVIKRRIEQLPQVAMVDISGLAKKQVVITPDNDLLEIAGISLSDIEQALNSNNVEPGSMLVREGYYEYNIKFSTLLRTVEDIGEIFIRKNERIYQLRDLASVELLAEKEKGIVLYEGKRAVVLSIIKQSEENMQNMQQALDRVIDAFCSEYPDIDFSVSRNQTELLDFTISNLQQNLILAFIFVCFVSVLFLRDVKSPLIIGISMFISLIISLLFFYLCHISLNVVSLTGLILALGMMIDNSIIVTDNIGQYRQMGYSVDEACIKGTNEVITPMLSSAFTTISIFVPLVFLSGIAGAIFFDQAFSVTVGLLVSYVTGIMLLPVLYKMVYSIHIPWLKRKKKKEPGVSANTQVEWLERVYHRGVSLVFEHKTMTFLFMLAVFPLCVWLFTVIEKEKLPDINQQEMLAFIEWNENIHISENYSRTLAFTENFRSFAEETSAYIGQQQFLLNRDREMSTTESEVYLRTGDAKLLPVLRDTILRYFSENYPQAVVSFSPVGTLFEKIFSTGEPDIVAEFYSKNKSLAPDVSRVRALQENIAEKTGLNPVRVPFQTQLNLGIDREKLLLYKVSYDDIYRVLRTAFKENQFATLRSYQQYLPIVLGSEEKTVKEVIEGTLVDGILDDYGIRVRIPLSTFVSVTPGEDIKTIVAGKSGEYIPLEFDEVETPESFIRTVRENTAKDTFWDVDFSGGFFSNKRMINELMIILLISLLLMYFILAAQFENFVQPLIVLIEVPVDIAAALGLLILAGHTLNLMSAIGIVVTCGIIINDSILKIDIMNQLRKTGMPLMEVIHEAGRRRLKAILMTSLTTIVCMAPLLMSHDMGSELEKPLALASIAGMVVGTPVSLFVIPLLYWAIYHRNEPKEQSK